MRKLLTTLALILSITISGTSQTIIENDDPHKFITLLKNNTYQIKEITEDSLLLYMGKLSSIDPEIRHGNFYFFNNKGKVVVTGFYNQDIPCGTWVYYNENNDTIKSVDYSAVWNYLENDALDYKIDTSVLENLKSRDKETMNPDGTFYIAKKMPKFNGGEPLLEFNKYLVNNLIYPVYSARKNITGTVIVQFIIDDNGYVRNPVVVNSIYPDLNIEAIRLFAESPKWESGKQGKYPVNVLLTWPVRFYPENINFILPTCFLFKEDDSFLTELVDQLPLYKGKDPAIGFRKFICNNLNYPISAAKKGISGRVIVEFTIMTDGTVDSISVIQSVDPALDAEAVRVVGAGKEWTPGTLDGKNVPVIMTFPFNFVLQ